MVQRKALSDFLTSARLVLFQLLRLYFSGYRPEDVGNGWL